MSIWIHMGKCNNLPWHSKSPAKVCKKRSNGLAGFSRRIARRHARYRVISSYSADRFTSDLNVNERSVHDLSLFVNSFALMWIVRDCVSFIISFSAGWFLFLKTERKELERIVFVAECSKVFSLPMKWYAFRNESNYN